MDIYKRRRYYQQMIFRRFRDIEFDKSFAHNRMPKDQLGQRESIKMELVRDTLAWYEKKLGVVIERPIMEDTKWNLWGGTNTLRTLIFFSLFSGIYYAASLYTTIGESL
jgi:hypothetical protein